VSQPEWVVATTRSKLPKSIPLAVYPKGVAVLLVQLGEDLYAIANRCAHMACPLEMGRLDGEIITCPCHDWRFNVRTGEFLDAPEIRLPTYAVKLEGDDVLVALPEV
jgi:3-phenylpropionate/trans-cinnamate dioxygenase ferredoxin subunit